MRRAWPRPSCSAPARWSRGSRWLGRAGPDRPTGTSPAVRPGSATPWASTGAHNGADLGAGELTLHLGEPPAPDRVATGPRVGLREAADHPWRFWLEGEPTVSAYRPARRRGAGRHGTASRAGPCGRLDPPGQRPAARSRAPEQENRSRGDTSLHILDDLEWRGLLAHSTDLDALRAEMDEGPVRFYVGFDPTAPSLHLGNLVQIITARRLQDAGHVPYALVGGATGLIGDPRESGERTMNPVETVQEWVGQGPAADRAVPVVRRRRTPRPWSTTTTGRRRCPRSTSCATSASTSR